jgi:predicted permease
MRYVEGFGRDIRYAWRVLGKRPLFAVVAVTTIGVGLAATTLAFAVVNALFVKGNAATDIPGVGGIVLGTSSEPEPASFHEYEAFAREVPSLDVAAVARVPLSYRGPDGAETLWSLAVSRNYFPLIEAQAAGGRLFDGAAGGAPSAIVSWRFWRDRLGRAPLGGLSLVLNGVDVAVIGVMPDDHREPGGFYDPSAWILLDDWDALRLPRTARDPASRQLGLLGRLRGSAPPALAMEQVAAVARELERLWPETNAGRPARFAAFGEGNAEMRAVAAVSAVAMVMVGLVLLIAIFNLAGLLLARAIDRQREMSLRTALGASRFRIVRQLVTESLVIAVLGGLVALLVSLWSEPLLGAFAIPAPIPQRLNVTPDRSVMAFVAAALVGCGIIAGLIPARLAMRLGLRGVSSASALIGGHDRSRLRTAVVALQVAGATLLLTAAAVFVQGTIAATAVDIGFERERALLVELAPAAHGHDASEAARIVSRVQDALRDLPGVREVSVTDRLPFYVGYPTQVEVSVEGRPCGVENCPTVGSYRVGPGYFRALAIPLHRGRELDTRATDADAVIVSEAMARRYAGSGDLLGRWISVGADGRLRQVVGVAADVRHRTLREEPEPYLYLPMETATFDTLVTVVVATAGAPESLRTAARARIAAVDPDLPIYALQTMTERLEERAWRGEAMVALFFTTCGGLALFLSVVGLGASVSYAAGQRVREFGVRAAIGADPAQLRRLVLRDGLALGLPGIVAGLLGALGLMRLIAATMSGVDVGSVVPYVVTAVVQLAIVLGASVIPARRAAQANPMVALRAEAP